MCATAGLFAFSAFIPSAPPADRAELRTIDPMSARGPDGFGEWFSKDGRVALGHRRLDIIDLTQGDALHAMDQPSIDGVNTWFVSQAAISQGIKAALPGLGGDELFASYSSFADWIYFH